MECDEKVQIVERQNSVDINRNAKGEYAFKIKMYWNEDEKSHDKIVDELKTIMTKLKTTFKKGS